MIVQTFVSYDWTGTTVESEEMAPQWYPLSDIPYEQMWQDDAHWLPQVLNKQTVDTDFTFDANKTMIQAAVRVTGIWHKLDNRIIV